MVWPWSGGRPMRLSPFGLERGMGGAVVAGTDRVRGLARLAGLEPVDVPVATGYLDTDYQTKARAALAALHHYDFAATHVAAPNEAALDGDYEAKVDAIERIDERLLGTILDRIGRLDDFRIMLMIDHVSSCAQRRALPGWAPFLLTGNTLRRRGQRLPFDERAAEEAEWRIDEPWHVIRALFEEETV
jgi:2,3-bisphosphoglycerate-independent phosphoglycerate mutase